MKAASVTNNLFFPFPETYRLPNIREKITPIRWSHTRRNVLEQCPRRYYYAYYASKIARARRDPLFDQFRLLKGVQNRYQRTGSIAHLVIATYLRKTQAGDTWSVDRVRKWAGAIFAEDVAYSSAYHTAVSAPFVAFKPVLLHEHFYKMPGAHDLCKVAETRLINAVSAFIESPKLEEFRSAGRRAGAIIERGAYLSVFGCRASGKVDLAFVADNCVTIADWKLGEPTSRGDDSLQLGAYALWAQEMFRNTPDLIRVCKVHLYEAEVVWFPITERLLANTRARIGQDVERMTMLHEYGKRGIIEAFTACAQPKLCGLCQFQAVCPEGRAVLNA